MSPSVGQHAITTTVNINNTSPEFQFTPSGQSLIHRHDHFNTTTNNVTIIRQHAVTTIVLNINNTSPEVSVYSLMP